MKNITSNYKQNVKLFGRQIDSKITYELDGETVELGAEELNSITPIYESQILKSVMKQLDIDSNVEIPIGTILTYQFGVKVGNSYEYTNYGNYIVKTIEKQEDLRSWKITCYDKMLYAMTDYESVGVTYPITIRNYINAIATHLNLTFKNVNDVFANYDKEIQNELYLDENGGSLGYTFRDVLDELAQATASTICINEEDDELEIRYINELVNETSTATGTNLNINNKYASSKIDLELNGNTEQITYSGKNLANVLDGTYINGNEITAVVESGKITLNGTSTANRFIQNFTGTLYLKTGTYTLSINNITTISGGNNNCIRVSDLDGTPISGSTCGFGTINNSTTFDIESDGYYKIQIRTNNGTTYRDFIIKPQLEKGSSATEYEPYVGGTASPNPNYPQDIRVVKGDNTINIIGKNLFDKNNANVLNASISSNGTISSNNNTRTIYIPIQPSTTYTISKILSSQFRASVYDNIPGINSVGTNTIANFGGTTITITSTSNSKYLAVFCYINTDTQTLQQILDSIQIEKGSTATTYEPYQKQSYALYLEDLELCKIGDYQDYIYKENDKWYIHKNIGKVVLDGSETYSRSSAGGYRRFSTVISNAITLSGRNEVFSNNFYFSSDTNNTGVTFLTSGSVYLYYGVDETSISDFTTWLSTHNTTVYYVLDTPTTTEITDLDLIEQLNAVRLMAGINNISVSSSNLASPLKLTYATDCEEIDEEYLKDINVNFGEKFGPVNSIVLSRASESDNVYMRNEISVETDGLCEIKIKDNQIMNFNDRSNYLPDILDKLYGLEYYINDFNSTGITYLDLCDKYYAKVFDNRYPCIMFNDEVDITQGLQETVYTEMPEESETDYKKADKTDRRINQAYIIVNKQEQTIEALTSSVETISQTENNNYLELLNKFQSLDENIADITEIENAVRQLQTNTYTKTEIQEIANGTAQDGTKVSAVITTSGTFDKDGLTIEQTTADTKTNINADGMIIYNKTGSTDDALLTVNSNGVITKNLKVETYTEIGKNSRFEDFVTDDYEDATAVFWIGS